MNYKEYNKEDPAQKQLFDRYEKFREECNFWLERCNRFAQHLHHFDFISINEYEVAPSYVDLNCYGDNHDFDIEYLDYSSAVRYYTDEMIDNLIEEIKESRKISEEERRKREKISAKRTYEYLKSVYGDNLDEAFSE